MRRLSLLKRELRLAARAREVPLGALLPARQVAHVQPPGGVPVGEQRVADGHRLRDALERLRAALDPQRARHVLRVSPRAERASQVFVRGAQTLGEPVVLPQRMRKRGALVRVGLVRPDGGAAPRAAPSARAEDAPFTAATVATPGRPRRAGGLHQPQPPRAPGADGYAFRGVVRNAGRRARQAAADGVVPRRTGGGSRRR